MLLEQAFLALPEVLHGSGYQRQDYEAGIVGAFSLAALQVLNGRNANNPIGCLQAERLYRTRGHFPGVAEPRYLRADLFLNVARLYVANRRLSQYGWRHNLWLEAKFFRGQAGNGNRHSTNKTNYVAAMLADIVRLATLVPEDAQESSSGRYLLHVYDAHPKYYLTYSKRTWCKRVCEPGDHEITLRALDQERNSVRRLLGDLGAIEVVLRVTNTVAWPVNTAHRPVYWCCLTRIDSLRVQLANEHFEVHHDRRVEASSEDAVRAIAAHVASRLHIKPNSVELQPVEEEIAEEEVAHDAVGA